MAEDNKIILEFPISGIELDLGMVITFDDISGLLPTSRLEGNFPMERIEGDLPMERVTGNLPVERVEGDIPVSRLSGNLPLSQTEGDLPVSRLDGNLPLSQTSGNLPTSRLDGTIPASSITGNLPLSQTSGYLPANRVSGLSNVATSGNYSDLNGLPTIPTKTSDLSDVEYTDLKDGQIAKYNGVSEKWENAEDKAEHIGSVKGAIASFNTDLAVNLKKCECEIVYSQAEGTPTPDNQLPITTFSEMNVCATGKNLFDGQFPSIDITVKYRQIKVKNGTYTMSTDCPLNASQGSNIFFISGYATSGASTVANGVYINNPRTVTTTDGYITVGYRSDGGISPSDYSSQIEKGETATTYEPYNGNTYTIPFGQTVAKGTLNVTTGVLRVTHGVYVITGNETFTTTGAGQKAIVNPSLNTLNAKSFDNSENANVACEIAESKPYATINVSGTTSGIGIGIYYIIIGSEQYNAWNDCVGKKLVYELATPIEIQLSATQVTALLNENHIWHDCNGDIEVEFFKNAIPGKAVSYDNSNSGLAANNIQDAIDELSADLNSIFTDITGTLEAGETSITLTSDAITSDSNIQVFAGNGNINYLTISATTGSVTIGFLAQASDMTVTARIS